MSQTPRGIRNHNPGNIVISHIPWQGKLIGSANTDGHFEQFSSAFFGLRALARNLHTYFIEGKTTVATIIEPYAPPIENNTSAYTNSVSTMANVGPNDPLDLNNPVQLRAIVQGIVRVENGKPDTEAGAFSNDQWYDDALVTSAVNSALGR